MQVKLKKGQKTYAQMPIEVKSIDKENHTLTMVASTQDVDRHGDTIIQSGWILDQFAKNPVILNSHRYDDATEVIANATRTEIVGKGKRSKLEQDWRFAVEENPKAKIIFDLYAAGFLHASSVGFIPREFKEEKDGSTDWWTIEKAELLEVSAVSVPANAMALAKAKGIEVEKLGIKQNDDEEDDETIDEISESDEVSSADEEAAAADSDAGESGSEASDGESESESEDSGGDEDLEDEGELDEETEEEEEVKQDSYKTKVIKAIGVIQQKEISQLKKVAAIIDDLLNNRKTDRTKSETTNQKIRKRKVNQAIRSLLKIK